MSDILSKDYKLSNLLDLLNLFFQRFNQDQHFHYIINKTPLITDLVDNWPALQSGEPLEWSVL